MKRYRVTENCGEIFTWTFNTVQEAENRLNENVTDIDGKRLSLGFDNGTWKLEEFESKRTKAMEEFVLQYLDDDMEGTRVLYNNFCDEFGIDLQFDIIENDGTMMCTVYSDKLHAPIIIERDCDMFSIDRYEDLIDYILELEDKSLKTLSLIK